MTVQSDLKALLALKTRAQLARRTRAVLAVHRDEIAAACASFAFPGFDGDDAAAAWRWVKALDVHVAQAAKKVRRVLPVQIYWSVDRWRVAVVDGRRTMAHELTDVVASVFGRLLPHHHVKRARSLLAEPHDVAAAGSTLFFNARPSRHAPQGRLIEWLDAERFGPFADRVRAELDEIAVAAVDATAALDVSGATPLARWQRLSSSLKSAAVSLWLDVKPRSIGIDAGVLIGSPQRSVESAATAAAVERLLKRSGLPPAAIASLYEDVAARTRPTRSLWIDTVLHLRRRHTWSFARPRSTTKTSETSKAAKAKKAKARKKATKKKRASAP